MEKVKQGRNPIDTLTEIRKTFKLKQTKARDIHTPAKRPRFNQDDSDDDLKIISSRRVKRPRSPSHQASRNLRETRPPLTISTSIAPTPTNSERNTPSTSRPTPSRATQSPRTRFTANGATLYICPHSGCEKTCRTLERLTSHIDSEHTREVRSSKTVKQTGAVDTNVKSEGQNQNVVNLKSVGLPPLRTKPQPNRCRERLGNSLFASPDPTSVSTSRSSQEAHEEEIQTATKNQGKAPAEPQKAPPATPSPSVQLPRSASEENLIRESKNQLGEPLHCTILTCKKSYYLRDDFDHHLSHAHKGQRLRPNSDGSFSILDPKTNQPLEDTPINSFMCDGCGRRFKSDNGLDFHISRSSTCKTVPSTHPALLAYKPTDGPLPDSQVGPMTPPESAKDVRYERPSTRFHTAGKVVENPVHEPTMTESRKHTKGISRWSGDRTRSGVASEGADIFRGGISMGDLGLSSDSSDDEDHVEGGEDRLRPMPAAGNELGVRETRSAEGLEGGEDLRQRAPVAINGNSPKGPRSIQEPGDGDQKGQQDPVADLELSSKGNRLAKEKAMNKIQAQRHGGRLPAEPNSWAEASDADKRLLAQGHYNVTGRLIQQSWQKATGLQTGIGPLMLRYHKLVAIMGNEASRDLPLFIDSGDESDGKFDLTRTHVQASVRGSRKQLGFPLSWGEASKADKRMVYMKEKGHKWFAIQKVFEFITQQHVREDTLSARFRRLVAMRDEAQSGKQASHDENEDVEESLVGQDSHDNSEQSKTLDVITSTVGLPDRNDSENGTDDHPVTDGTACLQRRKESLPERDPYEEPTALDLKVTEPAHAPESGSCHNTVDAVIDPDQMLVRMREGKENYSNVRAAWENATNRRTAAGTAWKQGLATVGTEDMSFLLAAEAVVEAHFSQAKFAMIAEIMRASGADQDKAFVLENELRRLTQAAVPVAESRKDSQIALEPAAEPINNSIQGLEAKLSAQLTQQIEALTAANRVEMDRTINAIREEARNSRSAVLEEVTESPGHVNQIEH